MGYYINPKNMSKEQWLIENGHEVFAFGTFEEASKDDVLPVVWVDNGASSAAAVAYDARELDDFIGNPKDKRPMRYFLVPVDALIEVEALPEGFKVKQ